MTTTHTTLPDGWIETTLGEVSDFQYGLGESAQETGEYLYIRITDINTDGSLKKSNLVYISQDKVSEKDILKKGDILVARTGASYGKSYIFKEDIKSTFGGFLIRLVLDESKINNYFLFSFMRTHLYWGQANSLVGGGAQPQFNANVICNIKLLLPPLPEQKAIAKILSSFDDKIELLREQNETLEKMAQTIFEEWFGKYSVDDELPEGWRVGKLGEVIKFIKGKKPTETNEKKISGFLPQILIETFDTGKVLYANTKNTILSNEKDLLMVMDGASSGRLEVGYNGIVGSTLSKIEIEENLRLLVFALLKSRFKEINDGTTGSSIPHTDKAKIYDFDYFITDEDYLKSFNQLYGNFLSKILDNKKQIQILSKTRDELLPKLMKGEVRVV